MFLQMRTFEHEKNHKVSFEHDDSKMHRQPVHEGRSRRSIGAQICMLWQLMNIFLMLSIGGRLGEQHNKETSRTNSWYAVRFSCTRGPFWRRFTKGV